MNVLINDLNESTYFEGSSKEFQKKDIAKQYKEVILNSLITTFGLDFIFGQDRHGGHVDTLHNAAKIKEEHDLAKAGDSSFERKFDGFNNKKYQERLDNHKSYDKTVSQKYHKHANYIETNRQGSIDKKSGKKIDAYTGKRFDRNDGMDLDHVISAKEIHEDGRRLLVDQTGEDLANQSSNLVHTDRSLNRSKQAKKMEDFVAQLDERASERRQKIEKLQAMEERTNRQEKELKKLKKFEEADLEKMKQIDENARAQYESSLNQQYYMSKNFVTDTFQASAAQGIRMGKRQAIGLILFELYRVLEKRIPKFLKRVRKERLKISVVFEELGMIVKKSYKKVKSKLGDILKQFQEGFLSGILSSITTTLVNIFATTAKQAGKLIRELWVSIVEAVKILFLNPEGLAFGKQLEAVSKIIATALSTSVGTLVFAEIKAMSFFASNSVATFAGAVVTGLMSVSIINFIENSEKIQKLVAYFNRCKSQAALDLEYYQKVNQELNRYASELQEIPLDAYEQRLEKVTKVNSLIENSKTDADVSSALDILINEYQIELPYDGTIAGLDAFMNDADSQLIFE